KTSIINGSEVSRLSVAIQFVGDHEVKNTGFHQRINLGFSVVYEITSPLQAAALRLRALAPASVHQQPLIN
ncbi:hypothetical protein, partial [Leclercia sp.]|uniref:hypothetical protein n=1 Tax=Leclercia sp. TaxID=1898428 RepID=UPI0028A0037C